MVLDVVDVTECYVGLLCLECGEYASPVSCGFGVDNCMGKGFRY